MYCAPPTLKTWLRACIRLTATVITFPAWHVVMGFPVKRFMKQTDVYLSRRYLPSDMCCE